MKTAKAKTKAKAKPKAKEKAPAQKMSDQIIKLTTGKPQVGDRLYCKKTYFLNTQGYTGTGYLNGKCGNVVLYEEGKSYEITSIGPLTRVTGIPIDKKDLFWSIHYGENSLFFKYEKLINFFCTKKELRRLKIVKLNEKEKAIHHL